MVVVVVIGCTSDASSSESSIRRWCTMVIVPLGVTVERHAVPVATQLPSVAKKQVSPHTIRHTTATHLLRSGVDINTIRAWLGHVSLETTNVYAEVDLEMKAKALAGCEVKGDTPKKTWREDACLMDFLRSL